MSKYGDLACKAVASCQKGAKPQDAWAQHAKELFPNQEASQKKGCPKSAFLGLAEAGLLVGVPSGNYTNSKKNKDYAIRACEILSEDKSLADAPKELWAIVMNGTQKRPNQQMEVVTSLWKCDLIIKST